MSFRICSKNVMGVAFSQIKIKKIYSDPKNEGIVKMLWYFVIFLDFFFNIIRLGEPKFTVSHTIFLCFLFVCLFLMYNFKTSNNFSPKICCENAVDVKNKIIISNWNQPQLGIKKIAKMLWHFVVFLGFFFVWHFVVFLGFFFFV